MKTLIQLRSTIDIEYIVRTQRAAQQRGLVLSEVVVKILNMNTSGFSEVGDF